MLRSVVIFTTICAAIFGGVAIGMYGRRPSVLSWEAFDQEAVTIWLAESELYRAAGLTSPDVQPLVLDFARNRAKAAAALFAHVDRPSIISSEWVLGYVRAGNDVQESWRLRRTIDVHNCRRIRTIVDVRRGGCTSTQPIFTVFAIDHPDRRLPVSPNDAERLFCGKAIGGFAFDVPQEMGDIVVLETTGENRVGTTGSIYQFDGEFDRAPGFTTVSVNLGDRVLPKTMN